MGYRRLFIIIIFSNMLLSLGSCGLLEKKILWTVEEVPAGEKLPIDGSYIVSMSNPVSEGVEAGVKISEDITGINISKVYTSNYTVRIDRGRIYIVDISVLANSSMPVGSVIIKNLKKVDDHTYIGDRAMLDGDTEIIANSTFHVVSDKLIVEKCIYKENSMTKIFGKTLIFRYNLTPDK